MASKLLKLHVQTTITTNLSAPSPPRLGTTLPSFLPPHQTHLRYRSPHVSFYYPLQKTSMSVHCSLSSPAPPSTKEEAILQAKTCLSTTLERPLNNPMLTGKVKKLKQPRFQVEIPLTAESPDSLSQLALDVFKDLTVGRKDSPVSLCILWPSSALKNTAVKAFRSKSSSNIEHAVISSVNNGDNRILSSADVIVFLAPEASQLPDMKGISDSVYPKPVVIFNRGWESEEETDFGDLSGFVGSFEVIYSFTGLMVEGVLSNRRGAVFKCVSDGIVSGEKWNVFVEEEGELKVVSSFKARPSIRDVENVLYNVMAVNSPITKSAKFLKGLVSSITGKKS